MRALLETEKELVIGRSDSSYPALAEPAPGNGCPRVWGLTAHELHEAYWRAHGVQCVERGAPIRLERFADFYLLCDPRQLVLFDLPGLAEQLVWQGAWITRLRLVAEDGRAYTERVVLDIAGRVERIARRYKPIPREACRVFLTQHRRLASMWMKSRTRREAWKTISRAAGLSRVENCRYKGWSFESGRATDECRYISKLVCHWDRPTRSLEGLCEIRPHVWTLAEARIDDVQVAVGPAWIGQVKADSMPASLIGPLWVADSHPPAEPGTHKARLMQIQEIEPSEGIRRTDRGTSSRGSYLIAKRVLDIGFSALALVLTVPVFVFVAAVILLQDGPPVFYAQVRQGRGGRSFKCWKFRTMYRDTDRLTDELAARNKCDGPQVFIEDDPRVTPVGRVLRRFQIDEFPQFWNVLIGQMSVVGPRPSPDEENQFCPAWRELRLSVRPGITGLWQLNRTRAPGRDFQEWIRYDVEYVRRANLWLDLKICLRTARLLMTGGRGTCA